MVASKVLIVGGRGYLGSALITLMHLAGQQPAVLPVSANKVESWADYLNNIDTVVYLSAQTDHIWSNQYPVADLTGSVMPFLEMLEQMAKLGKRKVIFLGSDTQVGLVTRISKQPPYQRDCPITIYDVHKCTCEHYLRVFAHEYGISGVTLRLSTVYGPSPAESGGQSRGFVNRAIRQAVDGELTTYYYGLMRDYIYIDDVCRAIVAACENDLAYGEYYQVCTGRPVKITDLGSLIQSVVQIELKRTPPVAFVEYPDDLPWIDRRAFWTDYDDFRIHTGWEPAVDLEEGVTRTVRYYAKT